MKIEITNTSDAPQGVHTETGVMFVNPGKTRTLDVTDDYLPRLKRLPFLTVAGAEQAEDRKGNNIPAPLPADELLISMDDDEFAAFYESVTGKKPHHAAKRETLIAKLRED